MRAWVCHQLTDDRAGLRLERDWPEPPPPGPGELRIRITACALNYPDLLMLSGGYQYRPDLPFIPGMEACGVIDEVGEGLMGDLLGERVIVGARSGCLAEYITLPAAAIRSVPHGFHDVEAAAHHVGALTAYVGLVHRGRLAAGDRVLVLGAGGGMGLAAVGIARMLGAEVTAAAASEAKLDAAKAAGAQHGILLDRSAPDLDGCRDRFNVVFDPIAGTLFEPAMRTLAWNGRYLLIGLVGGTPTLALNRALLKGVEVIGVRAGEQGRRDPQSALDAVHAIDAFAERGLKPHVGLNLPMPAAADAFAAMAAGHLVGKAVIRCSE